MVTVFYYCIMTAVAFLLIGKLLMCVFKHHSLLRIFCCLRFLIVVFCSGFREVHLAIKSIISSVINKDLKSSIINPLFCNSLISVISPFHVLDSYT